MTLLQPDPPPSVGNTPPIPKKGGVELAGMFSHAPPVMIVGTGRSGSSYIAKLLQHVQIECGHENWWTPMASRQRFELDADSSWMAAPFMDPMDYGTETFIYKGVKLLQVREPLAVISSYMGILNGKFMRGEALDDPFWRLHIAALPRLAFSKDAAYNAASWWYEMNKYSLERVDHWWRVEDMGTDLLLQVCEWAKWTIDPQVAADAVEQVREDTHTLKWKKPRMGWEDIPTGIREQCQELADELGYER